MAKNPAAVIVGKNIATEAEQRGLGFAELCAALNVQPETLMRWTTGERMITVYGLLRASRILGVPMERLTDGIE